MTANRMLKLRQNFRPSHLRGFCVAGSQHVSQEVIPVAAEAASTSQDGGTRKRKWGLSALFLFLPCAATFGLGTWQLFRRQWKIDLLDYRQERLEEPPVPLVAALVAVQEKSEEVNSQQVPKDLIDSLEFRRVICEGIYDEDQSIYIGPRMGSVSVYGSKQKGYFIVTPLLPATADSNVNSAVLVNRGWVPSSWKDGKRERSKTLEIPHTKSAEKKADSKGGWWNSWFGGKTATQEKVPDEHIERVVGVIRQSEHPNMFVPSNDPATGQWFFVDVPAMAREMGLPEDTPYIEAMDEVPSTVHNDNSPVPKNPKDLIRSSVMPNDHLNYAVTWYTLSAATTFMAIKRLQKSTYKRR